MWGWSVKKLRYVGGGRQIFPFRPPQDLKWNSPNAKRLKRNLHCDDTKNHEVGSPKIMKHVSFNMVIFGD